MIPKRIINIEVFGNATAKSARECTAAITKANQNAGAWDSSANSCTIVKTRNRPSTMYLDTTFNKGYSVDFSLSQLTQNPQSNSTNSKCDLVVKEGQENAKNFCVNFPVNNNAVVLIRSKPAPQLKLSGIDGWIMIPERIIKDEVFGNATASTASECTAEITKAKQNAGAWDSSTKLCTLVKTRNRPSTMYLGGNLNTGYPVDFSLSWFTENPNSKNTTSKCDLVIKEGQENAKNFCVDFPKNKNGVVLVRQK